MQFVTVLHDVLFNAILIFSGILGVWAVGMAARNRSISGGFWGAMASLAGLSTLTLLVGVVLALQGYVPVDGRTNIYFIYMGWLVVIMPGMFTQLRGRDDSAAALAFAMMAVFNLFVGLSMSARGLVGPWVLPA
jgi:hypothetical protein